MRQTLSLGPFVGLFTETGTDVPDRYASNILNVRVKDGRIRPRWGYRNIAASPNPSSYNAYGFAWCLGYNASYQASEEWVAIEDIGSGPAPYSVDHVTGARTEITNLGSTVTLAASDWVSVVFYGTAYFINPLSPISVYQHVIGDMTSWSSGTNLPIAAPTTPGGLDFNLPPLVDQGTFVSGSDTLTVTSGNSSYGTITGTIVTTAGNQMLGRVQLSGPDCGSGWKDDWYQVVIDLATARDWSTSDAVYIELDNEISVAVSNSTPNDGFDLSTTNNYLILTNTSGTASASLPFVVSQSSGIQTAGNMYVWVDLTGVSQAIRSAIGKITLRFTVWKTGVSVYYINLIEPGGLRYYDTGGTAFYGSDDPQLQYAFNYTESSNASPALAMTPFDANGDVDNNGDPVLPYSDLGHMGSIVRIWVPTTSESPFTSGATINLYRFDAVVDEWLLIATGPNTQTLVFVDLLRNSVLEASPSTYVPTTLSFTTPTYVSTGVISAFAMQGWVCWLYPGGYQNIQHSRVGEPLVLSSPSDDVNDLARGAVFSLSDSFSDQPVGGVQAGQAAIILGSQGVYSQVGQYPSELTPPHKVAASLGCAGRFAFCRFKSDTGDPGVAWVDPSGEGVWFVGLWQIYASDSGARPAELSAAIRGYIRMFLMYGQQAEFGFTDLSGVRMSVDEATQSLWIVLGRRALVLRPPNPASEPPARQWEPYLFNLTVPPGSSTYSACTMLNPGSSISAVVRTGWTTDWSNLSYGLEMAPEYATATPMSPGSLTKLLQVTGLVPGVSLPAGVTLDNSEVSVTRYLTPNTGLQTQVVEDTVQILLNGSPVGSNLSTGAQVPTTPTPATYPFSPSALGITEADINAGLVGVQLGWTAEPTVSYTVGDWTVSYSVSGGALTNNGGSGPTSAASMVNQAITVTFTWNAGGSAPSQMLAELTAFAEARGIGVGVSWTGSGSVNDGQGGLASGPVSNPATVVQETSTIYEWLPVTGGVCSYTTLFNSTCSIVVSGGNAAAIVEAQLTGTPVVPSASTVLVDAVESSWCYTITEATPGANTGISWKYLAFSPNRKLWALRSSGQVDEIEFDSSSLTYIGGSNIDGGYPMPTGVWESGRMRGDNRRLNYVGVMRDDSANTEAVSLTAFCDTSQGGTAGVAAAGVYYASFPSSQQGWEHLISVTVPESMNDVTGLSLEFTVLSKSRQRF